MNVNDLFENPSARGTVSTDETVLFIYPDERKQLLYDIVSVLRVTSYDGSVVYEPDRDYAVSDGRLVLPAGSAVPVLTPERYYSAGTDPLLKVKGPDGAESPCIFCGDASLCDYQIRVTYSHPAAPGIIPAGGGNFSSFLKKLESGEDVTVLFYGDSITYGADSSLAHKKPPYSPSFPILFALALAEMYDRSVSFALPEAKGAYTGPFPQAPSGGGGTLTLVNTAVGGWNSADGVKGLDTHVIPQIKKHGCDLFVLGFGMNDGGGAPEDTALKCEKIIRRVLSESADASVLIVSTMLPNPGAVNGWYANQPFQEPELIKLAEKLAGEGVPCAVAPMTSVSAKILERKSFIDVTGNNINHPNDYLSRVYAATLIRTLTPLPVSPVLYPKRLP